jgi:hypothetical protein
MGYEVYRDEGLPRHLCVGDGKCGDPGVRCAGNGKCKKPPFCAGHDEVVRKQRQGCPRKAHAAQEKKTYLGVPLDQWDPMTQILVKEGKL